MPGKKEGRLNLEKRRNRPRTTHHLIKTSEHVFNSELHHPRTIARRSRGAVGTRSVRGDLSESRAVQTSDRRAQIDPVLQVKGFRPDLYLVPFPDDERSGQAHVNGEIAGSHQSAYPDISEGSIGR